MPRDRRTTRTPSLPLKGGRRTTRTPSLPLKGGRRCRQGVVRLSSPVPNLSVDAHAGTDVELRKVLRETEALVSVDVTDGVVLCEDSTITNCCQSFN